MIRFVIALLIPVIALLAWTVKLETSYQSGMEIQVKIKGYDPRDLLSGHYIRYLLDLGSVDLCDNQVSDPTCVCLAPDTDNLTSVALSVISCNASFNDCPVRLKGKCEGSRYLAGVERYSIPERLAPALQVLPINSRALLSVDREGNAQIKQIFVGEQKLEDYADAQLSGVAGN